MIRERWSARGTVIAMTMTTMAMTMAMAITAWLGGGAVSGSARAQGPSPQDEAVFFTPPGFAKPGAPIRATPGPTAGKARIIVRDSATGQPTPCRINVIGPDGAFYQPPEDRLSKYAMTGQWPKNGAWGNREGKAPYRYIGHYFYSLGEATVDVPAGRVRIEAFKGFETRPVSVSVQVEPGRTATVELKLERSASMKPFGYVGGDTHLHFPRKTESDEQTILDLLEAEDIHRGTPLAYNEPAGPYHGAMERMDSPQFRGMGRASVAERGPIRILSGEEYRSGQYGHLLLYLLPKLIFEGQDFHTDDGPAYGVVGERAQKAGGIAIHAHGGYAQEIYADAALGAVNAVELLQFGIYRPIGLADWHHMLNAGYRFPCVGASDFPACRFLGDCRTYVWADQGESGSFEDWMRGIAAGRGFATTGPLLLLEVEGHRPGAVLPYDGPQPRKLKIRIRARCEVAPIANLDLIVNGAVVKRSEFSRDSGQGRWLELATELDVRESSWIAARAWSASAGGQPDAEAHSNPVYVYLNGKAPYRQSSVDVWIERIDGQIAIHNRRTFKDKANVLAYFQRARDVLVKIRAQGGLKADEAARPAAILGADANEAELREFLKPVPPKPPAAALKTFEAADGFRMELVAAEPLVYDPVAAAFDEDGRLYVCEMRDYPYKPSQGVEPIGSVRLLLDNDGDGRMEESHVFADKLLWAAGVAPWKGGVFVAAPPDIWYLKDTDGDHRADVRQRVFTGFGLENQQAMVNNLQFGLDHKIYGSTAGNGGAVRRVGVPESEAKPVPVNGRDFRFDPASQTFEAITGTVQFGNTFDDWGNRFVCSESQPILQIVMEDRYLARNPFFAAPSGVLNIAPGPVPIFRISPVERWRQVRSSRRVAKNERPATSAGASHHVIDAAAGVTIYRGGAYPREYDGHAFVGDGQNNLIHRRALSPAPDGIASQSRRVDDKTEMVRSSDNWFRPVNFLNAPDGTLYCLDMSREVLESIHIPLDVVKHLDLKSGRDHGRIYRLAPPGFHSPAPPRLSRATSPELVAHLASPHGWLRDTAHRLIYERQDAAIVPGLRTLAKTSAMPQARLHALWSLAGLNALDDETLKASLRDPHPAIREHAARLAEPRLKTDRDWLTLVAALADDPVVRVRYQAAFSLGEADFADERASAIAIDALARLARKDAGNSWIRAAILSSSAPCADRLLAASPPSDSDLSAALAQIVGLSRHPARVRNVLTTLAARGDSDPKAEMLLAVLAQGLRRSGGRLSPDDSEWLRRRYDQALRLTKDADAQELRRTAAIELLSAMPSPEVRSALLALCADPLASDRVRIAAIQAATAIANSAAETAGAASALLSSWRSFTPPVREAALRTMLSREWGTDALLKAAAQGEVAVADLDLAQRDSLLRHRNPAIRRLAEGLFGQTARRERSAVVAEHQPVLKLAGDAKAGRKTFEQNCMACHQVQGQGHAIGPNLASSASRDSAALLTHILDPNQYVLPNYAQYLIIDKNGRSLTGILAGQSSASVTLKREKGESLTLLRGEIEEIVNTGKSLMPEGFEKTIARQAMADLLAFLRQAAETAPANGDPNAERDFGTLPGLIEP